MIVTIRRDKQQSWGTPGKLVTANGFVCDTLELPWRGNQRGMSCITPDSYNGWLWQSPTMKRTVVRLENKHGRQDCLVHSGNFAGDTLLDIDGDSRGGDLVTNVHGCTLVGLGFGMIQNKNGDMQQGILHSKVELNELVEHLGTGTHTFIYIWNEGCVP
jgi:hypothetical protein